MGAITLVRVSALRADSTSSRAVMPMSPVPLSGRVASPVLSESPQPTAARALNANERYRTRDRRLDIFTCSCCSAATLGFDPARGARAFGLWGGDVGSITRAEPDRHLPKPGGFR